MPSGARAASRAASKPGLADDLERPERAELGDLLGARHPCQQVGHACLDGQRRVAIAGRDRRHHPFTDPAVRPPTMLPLGDEVEDQRRDERDGGVREDPRRVGRVLRAEVRHAQRQGPVVCVDSITSGSRNAFQLETSARTLTVTRAGLDSGSSTRKKNPSEPQPSIAAASSSSRDGPEERPQDDDRERQPEGGLGQRQAERVARQPDVADQDVQRQDRDGGREEQPEREQRVDRLAAPEPRSGRTRTPRADRSRR